MASMVIVLYSSNFKNMYGSYFTCDLQVKCYAVFTIDNKISR